MKNYKLIHDDFLIGTDADMKKRPEVKLHRHPRIILGEVAKLAISIMEKNAFAQHDGCLLDVQAVNDRAIELAVNMHSQLITGGLAFELPELTELHAEITKKPELVK